MAIKFIIRGRLDNLNDYISAERTNRFAAAKMKRKNQDIALAAILEKRVRITKPVFISYSWYEKDRRRDLDNISSFGHKVIQDALVESGTLPDDGWKYIRGFSDEFFVDRENPRIEVELKEV